MIIEGKETNKQCKTVIDFAILYDNGVDTKKTEKIEK